jgi:hypothetical protein
MELAVAEAQLHEQVYCRESHHRGNDLVSAPFELLEEHWESIKKFESCPLRSKTLVSPGFFAFLANCFGFPARPCLQVLRRLVRCLAPW